MTDTVTAILSNADYFILVLIRSGALVFSSPLFGRVNVPQRTKIGLTLALAYLFFVMFPSQAAIEYTNLLAFTFIVAKELLIGLTLGFVTNMFFSLVFTSGHIIDMQIGFAIVNVYDQQNNTQVPMVGNIMNIMLILLFFTTNAHHQLFSILHDTFVYLPVGNLSINPQIGIVALELFSKSFMLAIQVALPIIASGLTLELLFGVLLRTVPQLNMFVVGIPMKTLLGFMMLVFILPIFANFSATIFSEMFMGVEKMFSTMLVSP